MLAGICRLDKVVYQHEFLLFNMGNVCDMCVGMHVVASM